MAPVDLNRNRESMLKVHKEVSDPQSPTNWALFGYEGQTDVLKFVNKGDGGIPELIDELNSGRIMYAYVKILDPNTNLSKFVFVNWQPEGVPENRKGSCASHVRDVETFLRGAHVTINARTEDDVDEELVKSKVAKASGANYSFHKEKKQAMPEITPVGSVYQKVKPQIEIKPQIREKFWEQTQKDEQNRILSEKQRQTAEKLKLDKEIKEREEKSTKARDEIAAERARSINQVREAEKTANASNKTQDKFENSQQQALTDQLEREGRANKLREERANDPDDARRAEDERAKRSEQMRKERAAEAKSLAASRTSDARSVFEQKPQSQFDQSGKAAAPPRKIKTTFLDESNQQEPTGRKQPIQLPKGDNKEPTSPPPARQPASQPARREAAAPPRRAASPPHAPPQEEEEEQPIYDDAAAGPTEQVADDIYDDAAVVRQAPADDEIYDDAGTAHYDAPPAAMPATRNLLAQGLPKRQASDDEEQEEDQDWDDKNVAHSGDTARSHAPTTEDVDDHRISVEGSGASGVSARALYDYQAAEDNEITFDPDDIITNIDMIDEGWWMGDAPDGKRGMFPSNYVELIE